MNKLITNISSANIDSLASHTVPERQRYINKGPLELTLNECYPKNKEYQNHSFSSHLRCFKVDDVETSVGEESAMQ